MIIGLINDRESKMVGLLSSCTCAHHLLKSKYILTVLARFKFNGLLFNNLILVDYSILKGQGLRRKKSGRKTYRHIVMPVDAWRDINGNILIHKKNDDVKS